MQETKLHTNAVHSFEFGGWSSRKFISYCPITIPESFCPVFHLIPKFKRDEIVESKAKYNAGRALHVQSIFLDSQAPD